MLSEENEKYVEYGIAGLCNMCIGLLFFSQESQDFHIDLITIYFV